MTLTLRWRAADRKARRRQVLGGQVSLDRLACRRYVTLAELGPLDIEAAAVDANPPDAALGYFALGARAAPRKRSNRITRVPTPLDRNVTLALRVGQALSPPRAFLARPRQFSYRAHFSLISTAIANREPVSSVLHSTYTESNASNG